jgi:hypothetical protein
MTRFFERWFSLLDRQLVHLWLPTGLWVVFRCILEQEQRESLNGKRVYRIPWAIVTTALPAPSNT